MSPGGGGRRSALVGRRPFRVGCRSRGRQSADGERSAALRHAWDDVVSSAAFARTRAAPSAHGTGALLSGLLRHCFFKTTVARGVPSVSGGVITVQVQLIVVESSSPQMNE